MAEITQEQIEQVAEAHMNGATQEQGAARLGLTRASYRRRLARAAEQGLIGTAPVMPGYRVSKATAVLGPDGNLQREFIQQKPELGGAFEVPEGHSIKGVSALVDAGGREINKWVKTDRAATEQMRAIRAAIEGFKEDLPRALPVAPPAINTMPALLSQYTITDAHLGALAWNEETGQGDYDLSIGEQLLLDWFAAAIASSPASSRAVFAQLGDFLHYDSFKSVTPEHGHLLDGDTRYPKMVRTAIRVIRQIIEMLLEKHDTVDVIMADANHDPSSEVWLRELFAAWLESEPRVTVNTHPGSYSCIEHGLVSLFYHHGHRRRVAAVDSVFAGRYREVFGRTKFSYAHTGHLHKDELKNTNLMKVEQHETLAAPDAFAANGGWLSGRSAKVIHYHDRFGEVGRNVLTPEMVAGAYAAANDNGKQRRAA